MAKGWRKNLVTQELPSADELLHRYSNLLNSVVNVVLGRKISSSYIHFWFYKTVSFQVLGQKRTWTPHTNTLIRERIDSLPNLCEEDIRQQAILHLFELWNFYKAKIKPGKKTRFVFYDYVRFNLIKSVASWVSHQILMKTGDFLAPSLPDITYIEEPDDLDLSIGWVMLKSKEGVLSELNTRQKYLVYLRYAKGMKIKDIAALTNRHRALIEKDFSGINNILGIGGHYVNSRNVS